MQRRSGTQVWAGSLKFQLTGSGGNIKLVPERSTGIGEFEGRTKAPGFEDGDTLGRVQLALLGATPAFLMRGRHL